MGRPPINDKPMTDAERQRRHRLGLSQSRGAKEDKMAAAVSQLRATPLPVTREALEAARMLKARPTILDLIEPIVLALWEDEDFRRFVDAIVDSDAIEGSMEYDDVRAAEMIRDHARANNHTDIGGKNLKTLVHALRLVLKRYGQGRKQRGSIIGGETVMADQEASNPE
jgi:hypothetical protein